MRAMPEKSMKCVMCGVKAHTIIEKATITTESEFKNIKLT